MYINHGTEHHNFTEAHGAPMLDRKGRRIGYRVTIRQDGDYFEVWCHATRDGEDFGAIHRPHLALSLDEARELGPQKAMAAESRYRRKAPEAR